MPLPDKQGRLLAAAPERDTHLGHHLPVTSSFDTPFPVLAEEQVAAIIERHGLGVDPRQVSELPEVGSMNTALALGEGFVLRVPKSTPMAISDAYCESVAAPVALAAGLKTPALLVFDDSRTILGVPFTVYARVHADNLYLVETALADPLGVYRELGRELARLHDRVSECPDPNGYLDQPGMDDPWVVAERLAPAGKLSSRNMRWLGQVIGRLRPLIDRPPARCFLHDDAHPGNILVRDGVYAAVIDWNDAGWGDPALEFVNVPAPAVPWALEGYRELRALDSEAEARILWYDVVAALEALEKPFRPAEPRWWPPTARIVELVAAAASVPSWADLLRA